MKRMMISVVAAISVFLACAEVLTGYEVTTNTYAETQKQLDMIKEELRAMAKSEKTEVEKVTAYRIHLYRDADGSEVAYVVGVDGVERPVVLLDPLEYRLITERIEAVWKSFNSMADERRKLHGKLERTEIDEKARQKAEIYADGFRHTDTLPAKRKPTEVKITRLNAKIEEQKQNLEMLPTGE